MIVEREGDGSVVIRERWIVLRVACVAGAVLLLWLTLFACGDDGAECPKGQRWGGTLVAAALGLVAAVVSDLALRFDARARRVTWSKGRLVGWRSGVVEFAAIRDVLVRPVIDRDLDSQRPHTEWHLELVTNDGTVPLSLQGAHAPGEYEALAASLRVLVGLGAPGDGVTRLVAAGHIAAAVAQARKERHLSLTEAMNLVDNLSRTTPSGHA